MIYPAGGLIGSLLLGPMVDNCGRKGTLLLNNGLAVVAAGLLSLSNIADLHDFSVFVRFIVGICSGMFSLMVPLYVVEIAPANLRGGLTTTSILFLLFGVIIAQVFSGRNIFGTKERLPLMTGFTGIIALLTIPFLIFSPESPRFLLIQKSNEEKARRVLKKLRGQDNVEDEIEELRQENHLEMAEKEMTVFSLLSSRNLRWHLISVIVLMGGHQFSGVSGAYFYSEKIYRSILTKASNIRYMNLGVTCTLIVVTVITISAVDSVGRRFLLLLGFMICSICCILLTLILELQGNNPWLGYFSTFFAITFFIGHMIGPAPITYLVTLELFLQSSRASAFVVGGFVNWLTRFLSLVIFLLLEPFTGPYSLLIFWFLCTTTFICIFMMIPETRDKTFLETHQFILLKAAKKKEKKEDQEAV
ncbi:solute carrier family 2, facilitated glucose transporter member 5-like isoform X2 [Rhineura floridana]|nr:solute carrier family 2, facilitated glucose transporter member 5-like isoform X2 [Rhineura floridana]